MVPNQIIDLVEALINYSPRFAWGCRPHHKFILDRHTHTHIYIDIDIYMHILYIYIQIYIDIYIYNGVVTMFSLMV